MAPIMANITTDTAGFSTINSIVTSQPIITTVDGGGNPLVSADGGLAPLAIVAIAVFAGIPGLVCTCLICKSIIRRTTENKSGKVTPLICPSKIRESPNPKSPNGQNKKDIDIWVNKLDNKNPSREQGSLSGTLKDDDYGHVPGQPYYDDPIPEVHYRNTRSPAADDDYYGQDDENQPVLENDYNDNCKGKTKKKGKKEKEKKKTESKNEKDKKNAKKKEKKSKTNDNDLEESEMMPDENEIKEKKVSKKKEKNKKPKDKDKNPEHDVEDDMQTDITASKDKSDSRSSKKKKKKGKKSND